MMHRVSSGKTREIVVAVAPVAHVGTFLPTECRNPGSPQEIAAETQRCVAAGAAVVHLHVRNERGEIVSELSWFRETLDRIFDRCDVIVNASTGGKSELSREERCVALEDPRVELASLNMGSTNFGDGVYINTLEDIRYWAGRMQEARVVPELEVFSSAMIWSAAALAEEGILKNPLHYNICLGFPGSTPALATELVHLAALIPADASWGFLHEGMTDLSLVAAALGLGAATLRVCYEDGGYLAPGKPARSNADLVEQLVRLIRAAGCEPAAVEQTRANLNTKRNRGDQKEDNSG